MTRGTVVDEAMPSLPDASATLDAQAYGDLVTAVANSFRDVAPEVRNRFFTDVARAIALLDHAMTEGLENPAMAYDAQAGKLILTADGRAPIVVETPLDLKTAASSATTQ